jgi:hypothetical protein
MEIYFKKRPGASFLSEKYRKRGLACQLNIDMQNKSNVKCVYYGLKESMSIKNPKQSLKEERNIMAIKSGFQKIT